MPYCALLSPPIHTQTQERQRGKTDSETEERKGHDREKMNGRKNICIGHHVYQK